MRMPEPIDMVTIIAILTAWRWYLYLVGAYMGGVRGKTRGDVLTTPSGVPMNLELRGIGYSDETTPPFRRRGWRDCMDEHEINCYAVEGKRYPLEAGRVFKYAGKRGFYKVKRLKEWPDGSVEALCWWASSKDKAPLCAEWRTVRVDDPAKITKIFR